MITAVGDAGIVQSLLNSRYYDSSRGQFLSEDAVFLGLGVDKRTFQALQDPQQLNAYNYARNNPIIYKDPNGEFIWLIPLVELGIEVYEHTPSGIVSETCSIRSTYSEISIVTRSDLTQDFGLG